MGNRTLSLLLGFASGIMGAVVIVDLLPSSLGYGRPVICLLGFVSGFLLVTGMDYGLSRLLPGSKSHQLYRRMGYLIVLGIALHDLPEGIAIAAGYSAVAGEKTPDCRGGKCPGCGLCPALEIRPRLAGGESVAPLQDLLQ
jgi:ZIP family zinc transporter